MSIPLTRTRSSLTQGRSVNTGTRVWALLREILLTCRSQSVTSAVVAIIAAVSVGLVLGTAGLAAAAQSKVLSTVDQVGTRTVIIFSKNPEKGLSTQILDSLEGLDIVESALGFSETADVTNLSFRGGKRVALRLIYGEFARELMTQAHATGLDVHGANSGRSLIAFATEDAFEPLALPPEGGGVRVVNEGIDVSVIGSAQLPNHLTDLSPTLLAPAESVEGLSVIYLAAHTPEQVPLLTLLVRGELRELSSEDYVVETSQAYANLRSAIDGELTASTHTLIVSVLGAASGATMLVVWAVVLLRRKDLGRRRALGASRMMILALMMGQVAVLTLSGALLGAGIGYLGMYLLTQPTPPLMFTTAVVVAVVSASTLLSIMPALWAANRDPLSELRVP